jgi:exosortase N
VINNLLRIMVLVFFNIPPEKGMHEVIGLLCLVAYVITPMYFLSGWMIAKNQKVLYTSREQSTHSAWNKSLLFVFPVLILLMGAVVKNNKSKTVDNHAAVTVRGLNTEQLSNGITKISSDTSLIYVKPIPEFFSGEHTPLICWKGSGYDFKSIRESSVAGCTIYSGKLVKKNEELHTAWWYANGNVNTISQLDWRLRMLKGENRFCIVNVTAKDEETLRAGVASILTTHALRIEY